MSIPFDITHITPETFEQKAYEVFVHQYTHNTVYKRWCDLLKKTPLNVQKSYEFPYLPVQFFKQQTVICNYPDEPLPDLWFESSTTSGQIPSKHYIHDESLYRRTLLDGFKQVYGDPAQYAILGLLPSYLERGKSSLVYMVNELMQQSAHASNGFYLHDIEALAHTLKTLEAQHQPTLLFGVTYALIDFAEAFPSPLNYTTLIETGGMKGRKKEMIRPEVHAFLQQQLGPRPIHSEYGMTELMSQAWSTAQGVFACPPWMKLLLRDRNDPQHIFQHGRGLVNCIDLANYHSCSFLAIDDMAVVNPGGTFEILGRADAAEVRGCSLLAP